MLGLLSPFAGTVVAVVVVAAALGLLGWIALSLSRTARGRRARPGSSSKG